MCQSFLVWFAGVLETVVGCGTGPVLDVGSHIFVTEGLKDNNVITESTKVDDYTGMNNDRGQSGTDYRGIDDNDNGNETLNKMVLNLRDMATDRQNLELILTAKNSSEIITKRLYLSFKLDSINKSPDITVTYFESSPSCIAK